MGVLLVALGGFLLFKMRQSGKGIEDKQQRNGEPVVRTYEMED
jgi:hypothetical protein